MKYIHSKFFFLIILITNFSCRGQVNSSNANEVIREKEIGSELKNAPPKYDPYFTETSSIEKSFGPESITRNILQDSNGDIWLATWEGILKYDSTQFINLTNKEDLSRFHVFSLLEDSNGGMWFGTIGAGVYYYDGKEFTNYTKKEGLANDRTGCIYEDDKGNIWIGTERGISIYDGKEFKNYLDDENIGADVNSIIQDKTGKFWIGTRGLALTYDGEKFTEIIREDGQPFSNVRSILKDKHDNIWLGGNNGLWKYDGNQFTQIEKYFVGYIFEDSHGRIWTSNTVMGAMDNWELSIYEISPSPASSIRSTKVNPEVGMLFGIEEDNKGNIWFGYLRGVGRYNGSSFEYFKK